MPVGGLAGRGLFLVSIGANPVIECSALLPHLADVTQPACAIGQGATLAGVSLNAGDFRVVLQPPTKLLAVKLVFYDLWQVVLLAHLCLSRQLSAIIVSH